MQRRHSHLNKNYEKSILSKRSIEKPHAKFQEDRIQVLPDKGKQQQQKIKDPHT